MDVVVGDILLTFADEVHMLRQRVKAAGHANGRLSPQMCYWSAQLAGRPGRALEL